MSIKNSNDTIGNRTRDLPACSAVPQPTALPRVPVLCTVRSQYYLQGEVKVKVNITPEQATKAQKGIRVIPLLFFNLGVRWGGWSTQRPGRFTPSKDPVTIV